MSNLTDNLNSTLTSDWKKRIHEIKKVSRTNSFIKIIEYLCYACFITVAYITIPSFLGEFFFYHLVILVATAIFASFTLPILSTAKKKCSEQLEKFTSNLESSKQVCKCFEDCQCKDNIKEYLKQKGVKAPKEYNLK